MTIRTGHFCGFLLTMATIMAAFSVISSPLVAQSPSDSSADAPQDASLAIRQAIVEGDWVRAADFAQQSHDRSEPGTSAAARWAIALSKLRVEILLRSSMDKESSLAIQATEPIDRILQAYPDHSHAVWLRFQRLSVDAVIARRQGLVILAGPGDDARRLAALASLIQTAGALEALQVEVVDLIAQAFSRREPAGRIDQLMLLRNAIATQRVGVILARGELFPANSDDALAAAEQANRAAIDALAMVRDDPAVQVDLITMRCEALLRTGQVEEAQRLIPPRVVPPGQASPDQTSAVDDATRAMAVRIALAQNRSGDAQAWLDNHYGDQPVAAPPAPESDLARLRWLIANAPNGVGDWIAAVGERGGDFQYRRAQRIALELLGPETAKATNIHLVLADAGARLRAEDFDGASETLLRFLATNDDPQAAVQATKIAAAALAKAGRAEQAARVLAETADRYPTANEAAALMLQSAVLLDQTGDVSATDGRLSEVMARWPAHPNAFLARQWLVQRTEAMSTPVDVAVVATPDPATDAAVISAVGKTDTTEESADAAADARSQKIWQAHVEAWQLAQRCWIKAFAQVDPLDSSLLLTERYRDLRAAVLQTLGSSKSRPAIGVRKTLATFFLDQDALLDHELRNHPVDDQPLVQWLYTIRTGGPLTPPPACDDPNLRIAAATILMIDGQRNVTSRRKSVDPIIELVAAIDGGQLPHAQALLWKGDSQSASAVLDRWIASMTNNERSEMTAIQAATLFAQADEPQVREIAIQRLTKLAKEISPNSPRWHDIQCKTIETLNGTGNHDQAKRLAKYILITRPPTDAGLRKRYEGFAEQ